MTRRSALYTIHHTQGESSVTENQQRNGGTWNTLGTYALDNNSYITLTAQGPGVTVADAIRLTPDDTAQAEQIHYIHTDHLGTPRALTDPSGQTTWRWTATPYGATPPDPDPDGDGQPYHLPLRYPGQYYDEESGLFYNYFRYYDPATGRYITSDPIGLDGGLNTYLYVKANPLRFTDPTGLDNVGCTTDPITIDSRCKRICCAIHDKCYDDNNYTADSWTSDKGCNAEACDKCNKNVVKCFIWCDQAEPMGIKPAPGTPEYYCPAQHRYITIPGDFPTVKAAKAVCRN